MHITAAAMGGYLLKAARRMAKALLTVACCPSAAALLTVLLGSILHAWEGQRLNRGLWRGQIWKAKASGMECRLRYT